MPRDPSDEVAIGTALIRDRVTFLIFVLGALAVLIAAFSHGRNAKAAAERSLKATIEEEDRYFCTGLGFDPANSLYQKCCAGAEMIRNREEERIRRSLAGL